MTVNQLVRQKASRRKVVKRIRDQKDDIAIIQKSEATASNTASKLSPILSFLWKLGKASPVVKPKDHSNIRLKYLRAGIQNQNAPSIFWGTKIILAFIFPLSFFVCRLFVFKLMTYQITMLTFIGIALLGFYLPNYWLRYKAEKRKEKILKSLPDALDLLVVCVEAGMGLDAAITRVAKETKFNSPELSQEFHLTNLEMLAGKKRKDSLRNLALRTNLDELNNLITLLIQTDKFGTSIADALRTYSDFYRAERQQKAEELAAKLPIKLIFPLALFVFPSILLVILGPAFIAIYQSLKFTAGQ
jgi:tight adherence protein C